MASSIRVAQFTDTPDKFATFYADYLQSVPEEIRTLGCRRVFLLVSSTLHSTTDRVEKLEMILGNRIVAKKAGVKAYTPYTDVLDIVDQLHESQADVIVCIGGGSYIDAAQIALLVHSSLKHSDLTVAAMDTLVAQHDENGDTVSPPGLSAPRLKLILVPTTLSGAPYSLISHATHPSTHNHATFTHPLCLADSVILDPELCTSTPPRLWLSTGLRAVGHCVEALCADPDPDRTPNTAQTSTEEGLRHLAPGLLACSVDNTDVDAKGGCQVGAWRAMDAVHQKMPRGASLAMGEQLAHVACVAHAETSGVLLPAMMKYNRGVNSARQEEVAEILWDVAGTTFEGYGLTREGADAGDLVRVLARALGLPTTLGEVQVTEEWQLEQIAEETVMGGAGETNPRRLESKEQVREVLRMAS